MSCKGLVRNVRKNTVRTPDGVERLGLVWKFRLHKLRDFIKSCYKRLFYFGLVMILGSLLVTLGGFLVWTLYLSLESLPVWVFSLLLWGARIGVACFGVAGLLFVMSGVVPDSSCSDVLRTHLRGVSLCYSVDRDEYLFSIHDSGYAYGVYGKGSHVVFDIGGRVLGTFEELYTRLPAFSDYNLDRLVRGRFAVKFGDRRTSYSHKVFLDLEVKSVE